MKKLSTLTLTIVSVLYALVGVADTREVSITAYFVNIDRGTVIDTPNSGQVTIGIRSHATTVDEDTRCSAGLVTADRAVRDAGIVGGHVASSSKRTGRVSGEEPIGKRYLAGIVKDRAAPLC